MLPRGFWIPETTKGVRREPFPGYLRGFGEVLLAAGHTLGSVSQYLRAAAHFGCWLETCGQGVDGLDLAKLQRFGEHLRSCRCPGRRRSRSSSAIGRVLRFIEYLKTTGVLVPDLAEATAGDAPPVLLRFRDWMRQQRGATDATVEGYGLYVTALFEALGDDPAVYTAHALRRFILNRSKTYATGTTKKLITATRMFLRFCVAEGLCTPFLDAAIPTVANWRLAPLPGYLQAAEIERIVQACDVKTKAGVRDRAILLLLARFGLRAGDIVRMCVSDIDWADASLRLMGKGRREVRLPLPQDVGDAILVYLERGRPAFDSDRLFLCSTAPFRPFSSRLAISSLVHRAVSRAGVLSPSSGVRVLRHSAATAMLREGASLQDVGKILRHRSPETTALYAKVDVIRLRRIAQPWPEVAKC